MLQSGIFLRLRGKVLQPEGGMPRGDGSESGCTDGANRVTAARPSKRRSDCVSAHCWSESTAGDTEQFLERVTKVQWGLMITVYCISYAPALLLLKIPGFAGQNLLLMIYMRR